MSQLRRTRAHPRFSVSWDVFVCPVARRVCLHHLRRRPPWTRGRLLPAGPGGRPRAPERQQPPSALRGTSAHASVPKDSAIRTLLAERLRRPAPRQRHAVFQIWAVPAATGVCTAPGTQVRTERAPEARPGLALPGLLSSPFPVPYTLHACPVTGPQPCTSQEAETGRAENSHRDLAPSQSR